MYHVMNRAVGGLPLFRKEADFEAFERLMLAARQRHPTRILAWCLMRTHWHFVLWPRKDGELTAFLRWLANTHAMRWHVAHNTVGRGHLYQGRFKSFVIQSDGHLLTACRYVERNALTAQAARRAEDWRWGSLWAWRQGSGELRSLLSEWPLPRPAGWVAQVNQPITAKELKRLEECEKRSRPYGDETWQARVVARLGLEHTIRPKGRPRQQET